jgi:hypothetical protein
MSKSTATSKKGAALPETEEGAVKDFFDAAYADVRSPKEIKFCNYFCSARTLGEQPTRLRI